MLQEQQAFTLRDLDEVTKRNRDLYERFTAVDIECNRVTEDLITANGQMDQLRNECANLRAEKKIWEVSILTSRLGQVLISRRMWSSVLPRRTRHCRWSAPTCQTSWRMFRRCTMTLSARARMTDDGSRAKFNSSKIKGKVTSRQIWYYSNCLAAGLTSVQPGFASTT
jgi:hypothetical protein